MTDTVESPESTEVPASEPDMRSAQEQADSAVTEWAAQLPWWRRPRQMRRQLSVSLSLVSLVSCCSSEASTSSPPATCSGREPKSR